jgi:hypothetical protein
MRRDLARIANFLFTLLIIGAGVRSGSEFGLVVAAIVCLVCVHECGHAVAGHLVGFDVLRVRVGFGPRILRFHVGETLVEGHLLPFAGGVSVTGTEYKRIRRRVAVVAFSGVGSALVVAAVGALLADSAVRIAFVWASVFQLGNLLAREGDGGTGPSDSDARLFGRALFGPRRWLEERFVSPGLRRRFAQEVNDKRLDEARESAQLYRRLFPGTPAAGIMTLLVRCIGGPVDVSQLEEIWSSTPEVQVNDFIVSCALLIAWYAIWWTRSCDDQLLAILRQIRTTMPNIGATAEVLSWALIERGDLAEGLRMNEVALQDELNTNETQAQLLAMRAIGLARIGSRDEASVLRAQAADLDPTCNFLGRVQSELDAATSRGEPGDLT